MKNQKKIKIQKHIKRNEKGNKKEIQDNIIYKDDSKIKNNVKLIHECVNALNHNYTKVKEYNAYLSHKVAYYLSFYKNECDRQKKRFLDEKVKEEIATLLANNNPFNSVEMVEGFFNDLKQHFFLKKEGGEWYYRNDLPLKSLRFDDMKFCERFVEFDEKNDEFKINENEGLSMMEELTYTTKNDKQQKALELLRSIDNCLNELAKLGLNGAITLNTPQCRFAPNVPFGDIYKVITKLK